jgi:hypothetical protein
MHWPRSFLLRKTKGFTHGRRDCRWADNLPRYFRQRRYGRGIAPSNAKAAPVVKFSALDQALQGRRRADQSTALAWPP